MPPDDGLDNLGVREDFPDGAVQTGQFAETVNLASLWELPLIFVCENNGMAEFTTRAEHTRVESVCDVVQRCRLLAVAYAEPADARIALAAAGQNIARQRVPKKHIGSALPIENAYAHLDLQWRAVR